MFWGISTMTPTTICDIVWVQPLFPGYLQAEIWQSSINNWTRSSESLLLQRIEANLASSCFNAKKSHLQQITNIEAQAGTGKTSTGGGGGNTRTKCTKSLAQKIPHPTRIPTISLHLQVVHSIRCEDSEIFSLSRLFDLGPPNLGAGKRPWATISATQHAVALILPQGRLQSEFVHSILKGWKVSIELRKHLTSRAEECFEWLREGCCKLCTRNWKGASTNLLEAVGLMPVQNLRGRPSLILFFHVPKTIKQIPSSLENRHVLRKLPSRCEVCPLPLWIIAVARGPTAPARLTRRQCLVGADSTTRKVHLKFEHAPWNMSWFSTCTT